MTLAEWMEEHSRLSGEWDEQANINISPDSVSYGSKQKAWWVCEKGHRWEASILARTTVGRNCPYCAGKKTLEGYNDLATLFPEALARWDYEKNDPILPTQISPNTHKAMWWKCERGHSWQARVFSVVCGTGCPYCSGKRAAQGENDLASVKPEITEQWCSELNSLSPESVTGGSKKKVFWQCELGHVWQASVYTRGGKVNASCPYCAGKRVLEGFNDLATLNPRLADEWCQELNGELKPTQVSKGSHKKVWWKCSEGHVWEAMVFSRAKENGTGCPICSGRYKQKNNATAFK